MHKYYADHNMVKRIKKLFIMHTKLPRSWIKKSLEKWDSDQGRAMAHAESIITRPHKPYSWSSALQHVGLIYKYWRMHHREEKCHEDYTATFDRIEQRVQKSNQRCHLPLRDASLTLEQVLNHLNETATHLRQCQKDSNELRFKSHNNLLATYDADNNLLAKKASEQKASAVQNIIRSELCRIMYNIRNVVKPTKSKGLQNLIKTVYGISDNNHHGTTFEPLFGSGQGS